MTNFTFDEITRLEKGNYRCIVKDPEGDGQRSYLRYGPVWWYEERDKGAELTIPVGITRSALEDAFQVSRDE